MNINKNTLAQVKGNVLAPVGQVSLPFIPVTKMVDNSTVVP
jgi:hypothetical protein